MILDDTPLLQLFGGSTLESWNMVEASVEI